MEINADNGVGHGIGAGFAISCPLASLRLDGRITPAIDWQRVIALLFNLP